MWPWKRRIAEADRKLAESEERNRAVEQLVEQARTSSARLNREILKNHWTEGFAASMARRGT